MTAPLPTTTVLGLVQMRMSDDPADEPRARSRGPRRRREGRPDHLPPGAVPGRYFCQAEDHRFFELAEPIPGPEHRAARPTRRGTRRRHHRLAVREARRGPLPQHRRGHRRRRPLPGQVSEDAHPGRPALLREVLFHARRPGLSRLADPLRQDRRADLLGPVVSRGRAADRAARGAEILFYPDRHRLASPEKAEYGAAQQAAGKPSSAATPSPTAVTSPRSTGSGIENLRRRRHRVLGRELRRRHLGEILAKAGRSEEDPRRRRSTSPGSTTPAPTGRSCATAGWMRMGGSVGIWTR